MMPSIALIDYHLDKENGIDVIKQMRSLKGDIPCVLVTADRSAELKKQAEEMGVIILNKPVKPAALRAILSQMAQYKDAAE